MKTPLLLACALAALAAAQAPGGKNWTVPRTPEGKPDLQGVWTNATITTVERPANFAGKPTLTDAEATAYEKALMEGIKAQDGQSDGPLLRAAGSAGTGGYNFLFVDMGTQLARVDGVKRTALIVDPPDGKIPFSAEARKRMGARGGYGGGSFDSVKTRPLEERCIIGFGSTAGPPMMPVLYNNTYQIVQTPETVVILVEMIHDARIIRINGTHAPANVRQWFGDSIGRWEGDTLVVDTTNFMDRGTFMGASRNLHVVERFSRVDANNILYRVSIDDPATFSKTWTMEFPFVATKGPVYEYACHEGNYAMTDILGGARKSEQEQNKK